MNEPYSEEKLQKTIEISKRSFYEGEAESPLSRWEFLFQQGRYIKKYWWLLQGTLLMGLLWLLQNSVSDDYLRRCLGVGAPFFVILAMPELWKNRSCNAMEVESTTFYSLRQIYAARLTLFAGVDLLLLSLFFFGASFTGRVTVWGMLTHFLLPCCVTCCICFQCLYSARNNSEVFAILLCSLWTGLWEMIVLNDAVYQAISVPVWCAMLAGAIGYLVYSVHCGQREWRQVLEVRPLWN